MDVGVWFGVGRFCAFVCAGLVVVCIVAGGLAAGVLFVVWICRRFRGYLMVVVVWFGCGGLRFIGWFWVYGADGCVIC